MSASPLSARDISTGALAFPPAPLASIEQHPTPQKKESREPVRAFSADRLTALFSPRFPRCAETGGVVRMGPYFVTAMATDWLKVT